MKTPGESKTYQGCNTNDHKRGVRCEVDGAFDVYGVSPSGFVLLAVVCVRWAVVSGLASLPPFLHQRR